MRDLLDPLCPPTSGADGRLCVKCVSFFLHKLKEVATEIILVAKIPTANSVSHRSQQREIISCHAAASRLIIRV